MELKNACRVIWLVKPVESTELRSFVPSAPVAKAAKYLVTGPEYPIAAQLCLTLYVP